MELWIELHPTRDEYADFGGHKTASGLFLSNGFCLLGVEHAFWRNGGWRVGLIILNIGFGVWKDK